MQHCTPIDPRLFKVLPPALLRPVPSLAAPADCLCPSCAHGTPLSPPRDGNPFLDACARGCITEVVSSLSDPSFDVNVVDHHGRTGLSLAIASGHTHIAQLLCACESVEPCKADARGATPLFLAAQRDNEEAVIALLQCFRRARDSQVPHVNPNVGCNGGVTPVAAACRSGSTRALLCLLADPVIDIFTPDDQCRTPLWHAALNGHPAAIHALHGAAMARGEDVGAEFKRVLELPAQTGETALRAACMRNCIQTVRALLGYGARADHVHRDGSTSFLEACLWGHALVARVLLRTKSASIHSARWDGVVALHGACWGSDMRLVRSLVPGRLPKRGTGGSAGRRVIRRRARAAALAASGRQT